MIMESNEQYIQKQVSKIKFKDVAGMEGAKQEIMEFVDFLKNPEKYKKIGATLPRGALMSGPPGTGKTLLAKACAGEANVPFFYMSGSEFIEVYVGVGGDRIRNLFKAARKEGSAIIFLDEIDSIGKKRSSNSGSSEFDSTLNQLLVEMDGFETTSNVVVFAATNRKELLDPALLRPGRLDRQIEVQLPTIEEREDILMVHLKPLKLDPSQDMKYFARRLASLTPGMSGSDLANVCNEAGIQAVRNNREFINNWDFEVAVERVIAGIEKKKLGDSQERKVVSIHESGHGVVSWFLEGANPLLKVTIVPRSKGALGFAQYLPRENQLETKEELLDQITCILAGRIAEEELIGSVTTGAYDDFQKAYSIASNLVSKFGMTSDLGMTSYQKDDYGKQLYSKNSQNRIDIEIKKIIQAQS